MVERTFRCLFLCWTLIRINRFTTLFSLIARIGEAGDSLGWRGEAEEKKREKQLVYKKKLVYIKQLCCYSIKCQN